MVTEGIDVENVACSNIVGYSIAITVKHKFQLTVFLTLLMFMFASVSRMANIWSITYGP
jgi:hypothetical protein